MIRVERSTPKRAEESRRAVIALLVGGVVCSILLAAGMAAFFSQGITRRLQVLSDNAEALARDEELRPVLAGSDEISRVDRIFHNMADQINRQKRELKASESKVHAILESVPVGIITTSTDGIVEAVNRNAKQMFDLDEGELIGMELKSLLMSEKEPVTAERLRELISAGQNQLTALDGESNEFPVETYLAEVEIDAKRHLLLTAVDITERRRMEDMKRQFVAMVSHDLRSPISSLSVFLGNLEAGSFGQLTMRGVQRVRSALTNTARLIRLINDLLDIDKLEEGLFDLRLETVSLMTILERSREAVAPLADHKKVDIEITADELDLVADGDQLVRVLVNLLSNAVQYAPALSEIRLSADVDNKWLTVHVIDRGPGIPQEYLRTIFERFKQVPDESSSARGDRV